MPDALRSAGLIEALGACDAGRVPVPPYSPERDPLIGVRNAHAIAEYSRTLAKRVGSLLDDERFPLLIGGDCSIVLGSMLALRHRGRFGLVYIDGHLDFRHPGHGEEMGAAAGEDLALLTGRGPELLTDLHGTGPLLDQRDVVVLGYRPGEDDLFGVKETAMTLIDAQRVRALGPEQASRQAVETLQRTVDGFWIHIDVDVLDERVMPAVDSPEPNGLYPDELIALVRGLLTSDLAAGAQVTIFDPDLDPSGELARLLVDTLSRSFSPR